MLNLGMNTLDVAILGQEASSQPSPHTESEQAFAHFASSHWMVGPLSLGYFASLTDDLRKEIWSRIDNDKTFARAVQVNSEWRTKIEQCWFEFTKRRFPEDLLLWNKHGKDWKFVVCLKANILTEEICLSKHFTGPGTLHENNGTYEGEFKDGIKHGLGKKTFHDLSIYLGQWCDNSKSGFGNYTWHDGTSYMGGWKDDRYHGFGVKSWSDGDKYEGGWKDDRKHGHGVYTWSNGDKYQGYWEDDKQHGLGQFDWGTGVKYVGHYKDNMRNDFRAVLTWPNGDKYEGGFVDNSIEGVGTYCHASGDKYIGEWKRSQRHGKAIYLYAYGGRFEGYFKNDERNGPGVMIWPDGDKFEGNWKSGGRIGKGKFTCTATGESLIQLWNEKPHRNYAEQIPKKFPRRSLHNQHNLKHHSNAVVSSSVPNPAGTDSLLAGTDLKGNEANPIIPKAPSGVCPSTPTLAGAATDNHNNNNTPDNNNTTSLSSFSTSSDESESSLEDEMTDLAFSDNSDNSQEASSPRSKKRKDTSRLDWSDEDELMDDSVFRTRSLSL